MNNEQILDILKNGSETQIIDLLTSIAALPFEEARSHLESIFDRADLDLIKTHCEIIKTHIISLKQAIHSEFSDRKEVERIENERKKEKLHIIKRDNDLSVLLNTFDINTFDINLLIRMDITSFTECQMVDVIEFLKKCRYTDLQTFIKSLINNKKIYLESENIKMIKKYFKYNTDYNIIEKLYEEQNYQIEFQKQFVSGSTKDT